MGFYSYTSQYICSSSSKSGHSRIRALLMTVVSIPRYYIHNPAQTNRPSLMPPDCGQHSRCPSEEQRLLPQAPDEQLVKHHRTPLPLFQLSILLYMRFCEGSIHYVIEPFINELLLSFTGGDEGTVAYLASVMDASVYAATLSTVWYLNRLSDTFGRKPIMVLGMIATTVSILLVGLSTTFRAFVLSRCIFFALNQGGAATRCAVDEMTDDSNSADAFALLSVPWALGMLIGPIVGGFLSNPHVRFPELFSGRLWEQLPYFLPCVTTLPQRPIYLDGRSTPGGARLHQIPIRSLLIPRVILTMANGVGYAFLHTAYHAVYPLFLAMSPSVGGLGLPPSQIGLILAARGLLSSLGHALLLGPAVRRFSLGRVFTTTLISYIPTFLLFPLMNIYARDALTNNNSTSRGAMWVLLVCQFGFFATASSGYTCMFMYIIAAAPNRRTLGAVNGLVEISFIGARLAGSALSTFMLGVSIKRGWMGGYAVYWLMSVLAYGCVVLSRRLPKEGKEWSERDVSVNG
ncbi:hypothetical protein D9756_009181 [Leucocoprinus leucothites]|uniref:Major facilitator superfamily (MFS) profile domain-containing protein n=1 Tax=Leucocoprinus leucothites TaxID=201217 RepID=A0A8H5CXS5_9AGAR|nr:hypothetical protein D9756_009181 [Leucoagaricus leucothites]